MVKFSENIILVDTVYLERVIFDLTVNFERMIGRRIPKADLAQWLDCVALDGGLRPGENSVQVVFIHPADVDSLQYMQPGHLADDLNGKAFKDNLGEFELIALPVEEVVTRADFYVECVEILMKDKDVRRVMLVGDTDDSALTKRIIHAVTTPPEEDVPAKDVTIFAMGPMQGRGFGHEILGYSLMAALGIRSDEF